MGRKIINLLLGLVLCIAATGGTGCQSLDIVEQDSDMLVDIAFDGLADFSRAFDQTIHEIRYGY